MCPFALANRNHAEMILGRSVEVHVPPSGHGVFGVGAEIAVGGAQAIPLTHFLVIVQGSFLKAMPASAVAAHAWPLALIAAVTLGAATVLVRSRLQ